MVEEGVIPLRQPELQESRCGACQPRQASHPQAACGDQPLPVPECLRQQSSRYGPERETQEGKCEEKAARGLRGPARLSVEGQDGQYPIPVCPFFQLFGWQRCSKTPGKDQRRHK